MKKWLLVLLLITAGLATYFGCSASVIPTFPVSGAARFLSAEVCVTCHTQVGDEWSGTRHHDALPDLLASGFASSSCTGCHVTGLDNDPSNSGYDDLNSIVAARFGGVQCENCHGAGGNHVSTYDPLPKPLSSEVCGQCHDGSHHSTYTEWQSSKHAIALSGPRDASSHFGLECLECHSADYRFAASIPADATVWDFELGITCVVCHDPHSKDNAFQLRALPKELCGQCHTAEGAVPGQSAHHSTVDVLTGAGGYEYPNHVYYNSYHTEIEEACVACHMYTAPFVSDAEPTISGHTWKPRLEACNECHAGLDTFNRDGKQTEIHALLDELKAELDAATDNDKLTLSYDRAKFNYGFIDSEGSYGIHNYKYAKALLQDSIADFTPGS